MSLNCDVVMDLSAMYHEGTVSEASADEIKTHLTQCPECRRFYAEYRAMLKRRHNTDPVTDAPDSDFTELAGKLKHRRILLFTGIALYSCALAGVTTFLLVRSVSRSEPHWTQLEFWKKKIRRQKNPKSLFRSLPWR